MKTKHHYPTLLIALILGLMGFAERAQADAPTINNPDLTLSSTETDITVKWESAWDNETYGHDLEYWVYVANSYDLLKDPYGKISEANGQEGAIKGSDDSFSYTTQCYSDGRPGTIVGAMDPGTLYYVVVAVVDGDDNVSYYNVGEIWTKGGTYIISLSKSEITMDAEGGTDGFTLTTNRGWNRDFHPREAASYEGGWIKISGPGAVAGTGEMENRDFTIEVSPNTSTEDRTATITFRMSEVSSSITVKQKGAADTENPKPQGYVDGYPKAISPTEIEVKWNPAKDNATAQEDLKYKVVWIIASSLVDRMDWGMAERSDYLQTCEYKISGLKPNTEYLVDVIVSDKANNLGSYGEKSITPPAAETPKPEPKPEPGPSEAVLVSSVTLDLPKVSINGDRESFQLKASVLPANATNSELQWSSSNPSVASVEAASTASLLKAGVTGKAVKVHIHKKGKAEITAQAMDGSGKSASCQVNVLSTVGNIEAAATRIYASGSTLRLTLPQAAVVRIYNVSGALVHMLNASAGDTSVALSAGVYVVRVGDTVQKVRIE